MFNLRLILWFLLLDTGTWSEGSYEKGSAAPSVCPPVWLYVFSDLAHLFFLKLSMVLGAHILVIHILVICDRVGFFEKKDVKNGQKVPKNKFFWTFEEDQVFSFVWNCCKMKALMVL